MALKLVYLRQFDSSLKVLEDIAIAPKLVWSLQFFSRHNYEKKQSEFGLAINGKDFVLNVLNDDAELTVEKRQKLVSDLVKNIREAQVLIMEMMVD